MHQVEPPHKVKGDTCLTTSKQHFHLLTAASSTGKVTSLIATMLGRHLVNKSLQHAHGIKDQCKMKLKA